jgi:hypothetical protein
VRTAFKEWAVIADALGRGEQIIILRKGGISEGPGGFRVEQPEFVIFPTLFHQQRESVTPAAQARYDQLAADFPAPEVVRVEFCAQVVDWRHLTSLSSANRLRGQHCWRDDVIARRFDWGRVQSIYALAVRVFRLRARLELPMRPAYAGCKSWIELESDLDTRGARPVLDDGAFGQKLEQFRAALNSGPSDACPT